MARSIKDLDGRLVVNISENVFGHVVAELDNYARLRLSEEIPTETLCLLFGGPNTILEEVVKMFPGYFNAVSMELTHKHFADHVVNCFPELALDVGISSYKVLQPDRGYMRAELENNHITYRTGFLNGIYFDTIKYYKRIKATPDREPLRMETPCPPDLREFTDRGGRPIVVLQLRLVISSGNRVIATDDSYAPTLEYLRDCGYTIVFSGREVFPEEWRKYDLIDYANSDLAAPENDFHLYRLAKFGLLAASGTNLLAEVQCMPYVQINSAQGAVPTYSKNSIMLPSIWSNPETGEMASALEHIRHNLNYGVGNVPDMRALSVSGADILEATQELEHLVENWTPRSELQDRWFRTGKDLWEGKSLWNGQTLWEGLQESPWIGGNDELLDGQNEESLMSLAESRVSQKFLEKHERTLFR